LPKMDQKIVQKVCVGLLKSGEELKNQAEVEKKKKQSLMFSKDIIPKPDIRLFTEHFLSSWSFLPAVFSIGVLRSLQSLCTSSQGPLLTSTTVCTRFSIIPFIFWHDW